MCAVNSLWIWLRGAGLCMMCGLFSMLVRFEPKPFHTKAKSQCYFNRFVKMRVFHVEIQVDF